MMNHIERREKQSWRIEKNIPITVIVILIIQTGMFMSKIEDHERRITMAEAYDRDYSRSTLEICQRLARVEEKVGGITTLLEQINTKMNMSSPVTR